MSGRFRRLSKVLKIVVTCVAGLAAALVGLKWYLFPYGPSHCCILVVGLELRSYAEAHGGVFPRGEASPEASLSLISRRAPDNSTDAPRWDELLRGKTVAVEKVRARLDAGKLLDAESCGWHYEEGLTLRDDPEIAIIWDKVGLGHNGMRLFGGGHEVYFLGGNRQFIKGAEWPAFLALQQQLLASRKKADDEMD